MAASELQSPGSGDKAVPTSRQQTQPDMPATANSEAERLAELAAKLEIIPLPPTRVRSVGGRTPSRAMIRLRGRIRDAAGWLNGRPDTLGLTHSADTVGKILYGTVEDCLGDKQWSAAMRIAVGVDAWPMLASILKDVEAVSIRLQDSSPGKADPSS